MDYGVPVKAIMTSPLHTLTPDASYFDALLEFVRKGVDHLVIQHNDSIVGVVTSLDLMIQQGTWPIYLFREVAAQKKIEGLYDLARRFPATVRAIVEEGAKAPSICSIITLLTDSILKRLIELVVQELGPPPTQYCWLSLGVDGRREQTLGLHAENAVIYREPADRNVRLDVQAYFDFLASEVEKHLQACRITHIGQSIGSANPFWRRPYPFWKPYLEHWISSPDPEEAVSGLPFLDFRPAYGVTSLAEKLRTLCLDKIRRQPIFLAHIAADCLAERPPLSFYGDAAVYADGTRSHRFNLEKQALLPFVKIARLMALHHGFQETNTLERFELLAHEAKISVELCSDARAGYEFVQQLNLVHRLRLLETGLDMDSHIDVSNLSDLERKLLKETFCVINALFDVVKREFSLLV